MKLTVVKTESGWFTPIKEHKAKFAMFMGKIPPHTMLEMELNRVRGIRSTVQNNYYWWIVVQILSDSLGYTPDEMHEVLKYLHNPKEIALPDGEVVREGESTTKLDTIEAEAYFERIRIWAQQDLNIIIPLPNVQD